MIKRIINKLGIKRSYPVEIAGVSFKVPVYKGIGFSNLRDAEIWMTTLLNKLGSPEACFLDIGVNTGQTLLKWKALYPHALYAGFEPNQNCVGYLDCLIEENQLINCSIYPYAVSTDKAEKRLYLLGNDPADSSATTIAGFRGDESRREITVQSMPLSDLDNNIFDLIKIDVEGSELEVLESVFEVNNQAVIICEILPVYSAENKDRLNRQKKIESLLEKNGYCLFRVQKEDKIGLVEISEIGIHSELEKSDYVFIPENKKDAILATFT